MQQGKAPTNVLHLCLLLLLQVMDDRWESEIIEFGAINITGFRIVDTNRRLVREFYDNWKRLDPQMSVGAGRESISVRFFLSLLSSSC